jgi:alcohol dehydrogenase (cytochrome c)
VVALDADTGKLKWYFQFTPHDDFDFDSTQVPVLANVNWQGQQRKVMLWGNRNGFFYALDRTTGQYLRGTPFVKVTWTKGLDEGGRPMRLNDKAPSAEGTDIYPSQSGGTNWFSPSFSPHTGLFYVNAWEGVHGSFNKTDVEFEEGKRFTGGAPKPTRPGLRAGQIPNKREEDGYGAVRALDPVTGEKKWEFKMADVTQSGILTTVTDLLFTGGREGFFQALDARTGKMLWRVNAGGEVAMGPMTYAVNGKQYIAFAAGGSLFVYGLR